MPIIPDRKKGTKMRYARLTVFLSLLCQVSLTYSANAEAQVMISGEIRPGVYGRVDIGNVPPPPVVYVRPITVVRAPRATSREPLYLHVPPGHAINWGKHCRKYNACGQPVYFVKSDEYKPKKEKKEKKQKKEKKEN